MMPRANASTARVICTSGRDSERARKNTTGSAASATTSAPNMLGHGVVLVSSRAEGTASTTVMRAPPASATVFQPMPEVVAGAILDEPGFGVVAGERRRKLREVVLNPERRAEFESELAPDVGMDEIVAPIIHHVEVAFPRRVADLVEGRLHVDIDDQDSELVAVRRDDRRGDAQRRHIRLLRRRRLLG